MRGAGWELVDDESTSAQVYRRLAYSAEFFRKSASPYCSGVFFLGDCRDDGEDSGGLLHSDILNEVGAFNMPYFIERLQTQHAKLVAS